MNNNLWFFDWLTIYQEYPAGVPVFGADFRSSVCIETGELIYEMVTGKSVRGSFDSSLTIRSNGTSVSVSGNPSRWGRLDNLIGLTSLDDCVAVYNAVLVDLGLPPFTKCTKLYQRASKADRVSTFSNGAIITRLDVTTNHMTGSESNALDFLRSITAYSHRKDGYLYPNGRTVDFYRGSTYRYLKFYDKAHDMTLHKNTKNMTEEDINYCEDLRKYLKKVGCIREEHELKSPLLKKQNLRFYGLFNENDIFSYLKESRHIMDKMSVSVCDYQRVDERLIELGVCTPVEASGAQSTVHAWLNGQNLFATMSKSAFYRMRKRLSYVGIDIKQPFDVVKMKTRFKIVEVSPLAVPDWYQLAA